MNEPINTRELSERDPDRLLEQLCAQFGQAWQTGDPPSIGEFFSAANHRSSRDFSRQLAIELIRVDLQARLERAEASGTHSTRVFFANDDTVDREPAPNSTCLEDYLVQCPVFDSVDDLPLELIELEYLLRRKTGIPCTDDEFAARFPHQWPSLAARLAVETQHFPASSSAMNNSAKQAPSLGKFQLREALGKGGFGTVYLAHDTELDRDVAIKLPLYGTFRSDQDRERFFREARSAARLRHPNICPIYEVGECNGQTFIAMAYIEGPTLRARAQAGALTNREVAEVVEKVARAVHFAHQEGIVHRDIKPENIILEQRTGEPILMDFGLAKEQSDDQGQLTQAGEVMGTPAFMPPEQARGDSELIGPLSDVYSLGAVIYALVAGRSPFVGNAGEVIAKVQTEDPPKLRSLAPRVHRDLETICLQAMCKSPQRRYASAELLAADLERFLQGEAIAARREGPIARGVRVLRKYPRVSAAITLSMLVLLLGSLIAWRGATDASHASQERRRTNLITSIEKGLESTQWTAAHLSQLDALIAQLETFSTAEAAQATERLDQRYANFVQAEINQPRISEQEALHIEQEIALLEQRNEKLSQELRQQLARRQTSWDILLKLESPFDDLSAFPADKVQPLDEALMRKHPLGINEFSTLPLQLPSEGQAELQAEFGPQWKQATAFALRINSVGTGGYRFLLRQIGPDTSGDSSAPLATSPEASPSAGQWIAEIERNEIVIQQQELPELRAYSGPLQLRARREGSRLTFWVNEGKPLVMEDTFPLSGAEPGNYAIDLPPDLGLLNLVARKRSKALQVSGLEEADQLFAEEQYAEAAAAYAQRLSVAKGNALLSQELQYKQALCLLELDRVEEAEGLLESVMASDGNRWPALAACQKWMLLLRQGRKEEATLVFNLLDARYAATDMIRMIPKNIRQELVQLTEAGRTWRSSLRPADIDRLQEVQQLVRLDRLLGRHALDQMFMLRNLAIAHEDLGDFDSARTIMKSLTDEHPMFRVSRDYLRLVVRIEGPAAALAELDRMEQQNPLARLQNPRDELVLERCRLLVQLNELEQARHHLLQSVLFAHTDDSFHVMSESYLLLGIIYESQARPKKAQLVWKNAVARLRPMLANRHARDEDKYFHMLASLTGELSAAESQSLMEDYIVDLGPLGEMARPFVSLQTVHHLFSEMFESEHGRAYVKRLALGQLNRTESTHQMLSLAIGTYFCQTAFAQGTSQEQESLMHELSASLVAAVLRTGELNASHVPFALSSWKGYFGWPALAKQLEPQVRAQMAYAFGHRYLGLQKPAQSLQFFQEAVATGQANSEVALLAARDLDLLNKEQGRLILDAQLAEGEVIILNGDDAEVQRITLLSNESQEIVLPAGEYQFKLANAPTTNILAPAKLTLAPARLSRVRLLSAPEALPKQSWHSFRLSVLPLDTKIYCDDVFVGLAIGKQQTLLLPSGPQTLVFEQPDHITVSRQIEVSEQAMPALAVALKPQAGQLVSRFALKFNGRTSHVVFAPWEFQDIPASLTMEAWVLVDQETVTQHWERKRAVLELDRVSVNHLLREETELYQLQSGYRFGDWQFGKYSHSNIRKYSNRFAHVAVCVAEGTMTVFVDGEKQHETPDAVELTAPHTFQLGVVANASRDPLRGQIRSVRISTVARYTENFTPAPRFSADHDTLALYQLDEGKGNILTDSSGNGLHGTIRDAAWVDLYSASE